MKKKDSSCSISSPSKLRGDSFVYTTPLSLLQTSLKSEERDVAKGNSYSV